MFQNLNLLSKQQQAIWINQQIHPDSSMYNVGGSLKIRGEIEKDKLLESIKETMQSFDVLLIVEKFLRAEKLISKNFNACIVRLDSVSEKVLDPKIWLQERIVLQNNLAEIIVFSDHDNCTYIYSKWHHIIFDGFSAKIFFDKLVQTYNDKDVVKTEFFYERYIDEEEKYSNSEEYNVDLNYWRDKLNLIDNNNKGFTSLFKTNTLNRSLKSSRKEIKISRKIFNEIALFCKECVVTPFHYFIAIILLLNKKYNSPDFVLGTPIFNRRNKYFKQTAGMFVDMMLLCIDIETEDTFKHLLKRISKNIREGYRHQRFPMFDINLLFDQNISPNVVFSYQKNKYLSKIGNAELKINFINPGEQTEDLCFHLLEYSDSDDLILAIDYKRSSFDSSKIEMLSNHMLRLIEDCKDHPNLLINSINYLSKEEEKQLLVDFNDTETDYPKDKTIIQLIEEQVVKTPTNVAVVFEDYELTYKALNDIANQLSEYLTKSFTIQPDDLIAIMLETSEWMIISILAVLKSGGAFVPIDPEYPKERIDFMLTDSNAKVLIDQLLIDKFIVIKNNFAKVNRKVNTKADNLAYVVYTSGSTGKPKGVLIQHNSLVNKTTSWIKQYDLNSFEVRLLQIASFSFDVSIGNSCGTLVLGGRLVVVKNKSILDFEMFYATFKKNKITIMEGTPIVLNGFLNYIEQHNKSTIDLKCLIFGSDVLSYDDFAMAYKKWSDTFLIVNSYGVTEATIDSAIYFPKKNSSIPKSSTPIGAPISNTQIYILDNTELLVPLGVIGEICISGHGLARGYLNRPELTAEKFVPNPFKKGERMYKTGDLGRWLADGNIEFVGRKDDQIKIRGYRIELGEIESILRQNEIIQESIVLANENESGDKQLVAYLIASKELNTIDLRTRLKASLPDYMIPNHFVQLESFPLTPNGKLDKEALPNPKDKMISSGVEHVAPSTDTEKKLASIWSEVLGMEANKIGIHDDFLTLGGHSLNAIAVISRIFKEQSVKLSIQELFTNTSIEELSTIIDNSKTSLYQSIPTIPNAESYTVSSAQRRLWMLSQFKNGNYAYNMPGIFEFKGKLDIKILEDSFNKLIIRHESLRTVFKEDAQGNVKQWILAKDKHYFKLNYQDSRINDLRDTQNIQNSIETIVGKELKYTFNLAEDSLLRATIIQKSESKFIFIFVMHHIVSDGWSMNVLIRDLQTFYNGAVNKTAISLPELRIHYKDYAAWQQEVLKGDENKLNTAKEYWLSRYSDEIPVLNLPLDYTRPSIKTFNGNILNTKLNTESIQQLKSLTQQKGSTLFMSILASVNVLLYKYTQQTDIVLGSPIAGRDHADLSDQIGFYINTLALRTEFSPINSFTDLLEITKSNTLQAYEHQNYPFDELINDLNLQRDLSRNPLFDVMVVLQNNEATDLNQSFEGVTVEQYQDFESSNISKFDLTFNFTEINDELAIDIEYNTDLFKKETIERLSAHLIQLIQALTTTPDLPIQEINFLSKEEEHQLLVDFNETETDYPKDKTIIELFEEQVAKTPDNIAVVFEEKELTYIELNEKANRLGNYLRKIYSIQPDDLVAIQLERSEWMIVAILGILKSGGAYVPIDPEYPRDRIDYMLEDSNAKTIIDQAALNKFITVQETCSAFNPIRSAKPNNLAYVIYTSGSTGKPKGVLVENCSIVNTIIANINQFSINCNSRGLQYASLSFDASIFEIFSIILSGSPLFIINENTRKDITLLSDFIEEKDISFLTLPSLVAKQIDQRILSKIETIISAGDVIDASFYNLNRNVWNCYGPTEGSIWSSFYGGQRGRGLNTIPIGRPISNTRIYVLDQNENLLPVGVSGEICISGAGLARGYLNRPELTAEKFVPNPFMKGERIYKTGDLGRWLPNGNIEFIGRKDHQIKIRGYRIELGEIEHALQLKEETQECAVLAKEMESGDKQLVAYLKASKELNTTDLRKHLKASLPDYMIPNHFVQLDSFPLTPNGKLDKEALPNPKDKMISSGVEHVAPSTDTEKKLASIWSEVLGIEPNKIGVHDDFFALGGHSLKATTVISRIFKEQSVKLSIQDVFTKTSIEGLSIIIDNSRTSTYQDIPIIPIAESYELSSAQRRLWVLSQFENGNFAYNMPSVMELEGDLNIKIFEDALIKLIERHESLRTVFKEDPHGNLRQWILAKDKHNFKLNYLDLSSDLNGHQDIQNSLEAIVEKELKYTFNLADDSLLRATILQKSESNFILVLVMHHIVSDGWSMNILIRDLLAFYNGAVNKTKVILPELRIQYKDYSAWQQEVLMGDENDQSTSKEYWLKQFSNEIPVLNLPLDYTRPKIKTFNGNVLRTKLTKESTQLLKSLTQQSGATLFMSLLASVNVLLYKYTQQTDIVLGSPIAGRDHADLKDQIGFYINTLAIRTKFSATASFKDLLEIIKSNTLHAFEHQNYPFDQLVDDLNLKRDLSRDPLFDVMVVLQNNEATELNQCFEGVSVKQYQAVESSSISKFDLTFNFSESYNEITIEVEYNTDLFEKETIERLSGLFIQLIQALTAMPDLPIQQITYLSKEEQQLLIGFNDTATDYPNDKTVIRMFEEQVVKTPNKIAVVFEEKELTYKELNEKANQLGNYLQKTYSIKPDDLVAIQLDLSEWMIVAILGVLKSGGAYVPIDPEYPQERIEFLRSDSNAKVLLNQNELNRFLIQKENFRTTNFEQTAHPHNLAYVIYTSGSTGKPKGVLVENKSVANYLFYALDNYASSEIVCPLYTSLSFDLTVTSIFMPLITGGQLIVERDLDAVELISSVSQNSQVNVLKLTPSHVSLLKERSIKNENITSFIVGGEALSKRHVQILKNISSKATIFNEYGPTETTVGVIVKELITENDKISIGHPIANTRIYILDDQEHLSPVGVVGEICISGVALARGYLNRQDLTAKKFVSNPFEEGERMYKTGDLGRWLPDGNVEFVGRKDDQVKIRGYRIELGEIEPVLRLKEEIHECVVLAKQNKSGDKQLVAYLQASKELNTADLRTHLKASLPDYMIPSFFVQLESFPLTPNGKLDKKALPNPKDAMISSGVKHVAPSTDTEKKLVSIWSEVLGIETNKIGIHDDFFALGGHSLKATAAISQIFKALSVKLTIQDMFTNTSIAELSAIIDNSKTSRYQDIPILPIAENYELSSAQRRLWVLNQFENGNYAYNMPGVFEFEGNLDIKIFEEALIKLIQRHESLRTIFKEDAHGNIKQWILAKDKHHFKLKHQDSTINDHRGTQNIQSTIETIVENEFKYTFNLAKDSLLRATLIQKSPSSYVFVFMMHHIVSDGWSINVLIRDLLAFYNGAVNKTAISLPELRIHYKDYTAWQQKGLMGDENKLNTSKEYWLSRFSNEIPVLNLPLDYTRPAIKTFNGNFLSTKLNKESTQQLRSLTQQKGATLFMSLLASVNVLLYKYTQQTDIVLGSPTAGRSHADLSDQIGFYINTLALRTEFSATASFTDLLEIIKSNTIQAFEHQNYPFDELVDDLNLQRDMSRNPLFDVMVVLQNNETTDLNQGFEGLSVKPYQVVELSSISKFDLTFIFEEKEDKLAIAIEYNTDLFKKETIERLSAHLIQLIQALIAKPDLSIQEITYLSKEEEQQLLVDFNDTETDYPKDKTIIELFEEQVVKTPDNIAIVFEEKELTYKELNEKANRLGNYLRKTYSIQPDDLIAIQLDRSEWMMIAILGVLKSGGAYLPIDPEYPQERIDYMLKDSNAKTLIDQAGLNTFKSVQATYSTINPIIVGESSSLAYVIYTSGSTGKPKGVCVAHRSVIRLVFPGKYFYDKNKSKVRLLSTSSVAFDAVTFDYFSTLLYGKTLVFFSNYTLLDSALLSRAIKEFRIDVLFMTPSLVNQHINFSKTFFNDLSHLLLGGSRCPSATIKTLRESSKNLKLTNGYGPTECTTFATSFEIVDEDDIIPIGKPISNTRIYIVDSNEHLLPIGVVGEICIGGDGLARGYLNRPELTAEKFVPNPFKKGERMYKTGDLGRWLPDGNIEFIGRKDNQVKIRGNRIELGEIEHALQQKEEIQECTVIAKEKESGDKQLVAYLTASDELRAIDLRTHLKASLPDYMVPSHFVHLKSFPLTPNGKLDKNALPNPKDSAIGSGIKHVAPSTDTEKKLASIWSEVLGIEANKISIHDDFFALGGHSLKATTVISKIFKEHSVKLTIQELFTNTTIEELSTIIDHSKTSLYQDIPVLPKAENYELSSAQRRLWVLSQFENGNYAYNMPGVFEFEGNLDVKVFEEALIKLIQRHESLRTVFKEDAQGNVKQWILTKDNHHFQLNYKDSSINDHRGTQNIQSTLETIVEGELKYTFNLAEDSLLRATIIQKSESRFIFVLVMHHIVSDGWSMNILIRDLLAFYNGTVNKTAISLPELRIHYKDYAAWQQNVLMGDENKLNTSKEYWLSRFSNEIPVLNLPLDYTRPAIKTFNGNYLTTKLDKQSTWQLNNFTQQTGATLFMSLLASVNVLLYKYTQQTDIVLGSPIAGRNHVDLNDQIGFYVNTLALRTEFSAATSFTDLLQIVKSSTLQAFEHQNYPFDQLVNNVNSQHDKSRNPLFDVMVVLQNNKEIDLNQGFEGVSVKPYHVKESTSISKFDLTFNFTENNNEITIDIEYNTDLFKKETIERLSNHLVQLIQALTEAPDQSIQEINYLSKEEEKQLLLDFNDTKTEYPKDRTIIELFEEQVIEKPNEIAVIFEGKELTYRALNEKANQLGHYLRTTYDIRPDDLIAIMLEKSEWMIISILGILKSGAAYVPIDPNHPKERMEFILKDTQARVLLDVTELTKFQASCESYNNENLPLVSKPDSLIYAIYTSGSTGQPKGVLIENAALVNHINNVTAEYNAGMESVFLQFFNLAFDAAAQEIFTCLCFCKTLVIRTEEIEPNKIIDLINKHKITHADFSTAYFENLIASLKGNKIKQPLHVCGIGGDKINLDFIKHNRTEINQFTNTLLNVYGPTETTLTATFYNITEHLEQIDELPIGKPYGNREIYILDESQNLLPIGVVGEIGIAGVGLARGYLNRPDLTQEKFVPNPYRKGERIYRTGDLGCWLPDGNVAFFGRKDNQVKIRGFRIELGEIESAILQNKVIQETVVLAKQNGSRDKQLVAYLKASAELSITDLRNRLNSSLPDYMIPSYFVQLASFPLTPNGKLDKNALPNPEDATISSGVEHVAPRTDSEKKVAQIWSKVLEIEANKIGIHDDFFTLGGHSLKAVNLMSMINKEFSSHITIQKIYTNPTIESLARLLLSKEQEKELELLQVYSKNANNEKTFILFPYAGALLGSYNALAHELSNTGNVYIASSPWHHWNIDSEIESLNDIKAILIQEIKDKVPFNEIYLLGTSVGTSFSMLMAYELLNLDYKIKGIFQCAQYFRKEVRSKTQEEVYQSIVLDNLEANLNSEHITDAMKQKFIKGFNKDLTLSYTILNQIYKYQQLMIPIHCIFGELDEGTKDFSNSADSWKHFSTYVDYSVIPNADHHFVNNKVKETVKIITTQVHKMELQQTTSTTNQ